MKWIAGLLTLTAATGMAQAADTSSLFKIEHLGIQLSDDMLDTQRGKFVAGPNAHYFGIEFITHFNDANGNAISSGMQLNVNMNQQQPTVAVNVYTNDAEATTANGMLANGPNGNGVVQIAQVAGSANTGVNDLSFQQGVMPTKGQALEQGYYQVALPNGTANYEFSSAGLGMSYTSTDKTINAAQMVRSSKGLVQQLSIADNNKRLSNEAKFYMGDQLINSTGDLANTLRQQIPTHVSF